LIAENKSRRVITLNSHHDNYRRNVPPRDWFAKATRRAVI
jgi:hypothetical protein